MRRGLNSPRHLCLFKTPKGRKGFSRHRHTVVGIITILSALVSLLSFRVRSRASLELSCRLATSGDHPATPGAASARLHRPAPLDVALPGLATGPQRHGAGQTSNRGPVASQRLPALLAVAITPSGTAQDEPRDPGSDPSDEPGQPLLGRPPHPRRTAHAWHRGQPSHGWEIPAVAAQSPLPPGVAFCTTT
jgi:hypothetical protein